MDTDVLTPAAPRPMADPEAFDVDPEAAGIPAADPGAVGVPAAEPAGPEVSGAAGRAGVGSTIMQLTDTAWREPGQVPSRGIHTYLRENREKKLLQLAGSKDMPGPGRTPFTCCVVVERAPSRERVSRSDDDTLFVF